MISYAPFRSIAEFKGISYSVLNEELGLSSTTAAKLFKGDKPVNIDILDKLCAHFNVPLHRIAVILKADGTEYEDDEDMFYGMQKQYAELKSENDELKKEIRALQDRVDENEVLKSYTSETNADMSKLSFSQRVKYKREVLDLTQYELAELVGCTVVTISAMETGRSVNPTLDVLTGLCAALKCSIEWLVYGIEK